MGDGAATACANAIGEDGRARARYSRATMLAALLASTFPLAVDAAVEGKKIITAMLLVGLTFLAVIALGELSERRRRRRDG